MPQDLTDTELRTLANDPALSAQDVRLLTPQEQERFKAIYRNKGQLPLQGQGDTSSPEAEAPGRWERAGKTMGDVGMGALKGAGETATTLGRGVNAVTQKLGNMIGGKSSELMYGKEAVSPPIDNTRAFDVAHEAMQPTNTAQSIGKGAEQIGEYLIPAGAARHAAIEGGVRLIPDTMGPSGMKIANKIAALVGRSVGEAGSAAAVSGLHGEAEPEHEALAAAGVPLVTAALKSAVPILAKLMPYAAGGAAGSAMGGFGGMAGGLGLAAMTRQATKLSPGQVKAVAEFVQKYGPHALRTLVGAYGEHRVGEQQEQGQTERTLRELMPQQGTR